MDKNICIEFDGCQTFPRIVTRPPKMDENELKLSFLDISAFSSAFLE